MRYKSFHIENFKGIQDATLTLRGELGSVYTLVGINESGKTTILEAINAFQPDIDGVHAIVQDDLGQDPVQFIPRDEIDSFTGDIIIKAEIELTEEDVQDIEENASGKNKNFKINPDSIPRSFTITRRRKFKDSALKGSRTFWGVDPEIKLAGQRKWRTFSSTSEEWKTIVRYMREKLPRIIFFPTFLFDFPDTIHLSGEESFEGEKYYRKLIEDALASLAKPRNMKTHIIDRVDSYKEGQPYSDFVSGWNQSNERMPVEATINRLSEKISEDIFDNWNQILGPSPEHRELQISFDVVQGDAYNERIVQLRFRVKEGASVYKISERSLGFRWFFCFLFFTLFLYRKQNNSQLFLLDEPASNLHSIAQTKLLDCLRTISSSPNIPNDVIYSTHSHHLIHPCWLEHAYVITNGEPSEGDGISDAPDPAGSLQIKATPYNRFANQHAHKSHYFQPILDCLQVAPSLLEVAKPCVITEGKSDFYILSWYKKYCKPSPEICFTPMLNGAHGAGPIICLYLGLAIDFVLLLDSDMAGNKAKMRYLENLPLSSEAIIQIGDIFEEGTEEIEDLISDDVKNIIASKYETFSKDNILRAFSEALAGKNDLPTDSETANSIKRLYDALANRLNQ